MAEMLDKAILLASWPGRERKKSHGEGVRKGEGETERNWILTVLFGSVSPLA